MSSLTPPSRVRPCSANPFGVKTVRAPKCPSKTFPLHLDRNTEPRSDSVGPRRAEEFERFPQDVPFPGPSEPLRPTRNRGSSQELHKMGEHGQDQDANDTKKVGLYFYSK
jgi:hypothetical protein